MYVHFKYRASGTQILQVWSAVEDMWHVYNLVREGDAVTAKTFRKVTSTAVDGGGNSEKISIKLTVNVEKVDFDPEGKRHQATQMAPKLQNLV